MAGAVIAGAVAFIVVTLAGAFWLARRDGEAIAEAASTLKTNRVQDAILTAAVNRPDPAALSGELRAGRF